MRVLLHAHRPRNVNGAERYTRVLQQHLRASPRIEDVAIVFQEDEDKVPPGDWDLVHGMDLAPHRAGFARRLRLPIVMTSHVAGWQNVRQGWRTGRRNPILRAGQIAVHARMLLRQALALRDSSAVIPVSLNTASELLLQAPWARPKLHTVENGVDPALFPPGPRDEGYGLFVGRMESVKQPHLVVEAFARLGLPLRMVGRGPLRAQLEARGHPNVRFEDPMDDAALSTLYQGASLCVVPSQSEGYPLVVLEALSSGLPVLAHRSFVASPPTRDLIHWLDFGVFARRPPSQQDTETQLRAIMDGIRALWGTKTADDARRRHETVARHNSWRSTIEGVVRVYDQVLSRATS